jgi:hypothetical protein
MSVYITVVIRETQTHAKHAPSSASCDCDSVLERTPDCPTASTPPWIYLSFKRSRDRVWW